MAQKHGYATVEEFKNDAQNRFSLLETEIIDKPSTRLLLINVGMEALLAIWEILISFTGNNGWVDADWRLYVAAWAWGTEGSKVSNAFISDNGKDPYFFGRFISNALHMGYPLANTFVYPWMENVMSDE
jgi:hypothetical protein